MRMARINVYLPDELATEVKEADLNISAITQEALRQSLAARRMNHWLDLLDGAPRHFPNVTHEDVLEAVQASREEFGS